MTLSQEQVNKMYQKYFEQKERALISASRALEWSKNALATNPRINEIVVRDEQTGNVFIWNRHSHLEQAAPTAETDARRVRVVALS